MEKNVYEVAKLLQIRREFLASALWESLKNANPEEKELFWTKFYRAMRREG